MLYNIKGFLQIFAILKLFVPIIVNHNVQEDNRSG